MAHELCSVKNLGDAALAGAYDGTPYRIEPGEATLLDVECAKKDFGDWDARNVGSDERLQFRLGEYRRIRGLRGIVEGAMVPTGEWDGNREPIEVPSHTLLEERMPKVEIRLRDGQKVATVLEDPEGKNLPLEDASGADQARAIEALQDQIAKMQDAMRDLTEQSVRVEVPKDTPQGERPTSRKPSVVGSQVESAGD